MGVSFPTFFCLITPWGLWYVSESSRSMALNVWRLVDDEEKWIAEEFMRYCLTSQQSALNSLNCLDELTESPQGIQVWRRWCPLAPKTNSLHPNHLHLWFRVDGQREVSQFLETRNLRMFQRSHAEWRRDEESTLSRHHDSLFLYFGRYNWRFWNPTCIATSLTYTAPRFGVQKCKWAISGHPHWAEGCAFSSD